MTSTVVLGYQACRRCGTAVLDVVAYKTAGHCAECFRTQAAEILEASLVVVDGREKIVLRTQRSKRSPGERRRRAAARKRDRTKPEIAARRRLAQQCTTRARRRLAELMPELYEILLADERAAAGLNAYTIDRCLQGLPLDETLAFLVDQHRLQLPSARRAS